VQGVKLEVFGDANDYVGKGLSGAAIVVRPAPSSELLSNQNMIIGNTVLYGGTSGFLFAAGQAGERFAVRNSGALQRLRVHDRRGRRDPRCGWRQFGAGFTGGMAFVHDPDNMFEKRINPDTLTWQRVAHPHWESVLRDLVTRHVAETSSRYAERLLHDWDRIRPQFWQVVPKEFVRYLPVPLAEVCLAWALDWR
jgi:glutamate synthase (NADPH) large chain